MSQQPITQACPASSSLAGRFRQHTHAVTCAGDVGDERHPHQVHIARCTPEGHVCPSCALDWPQVPSKWPRPGWKREEDYRPSAESAKRIRDSLQQGMRRQRERDEKRRARTDGGASG